MKIAFILESFPALSETFILNQITGLIDLGHEVEIFARPNHSEKKMHTDVFKYNLLAKMRHSIYMPVSKMKRWLKALLLVLSRADIREILPVLKSLNKSRSGRLGLDLERLYDVIPFLGRNFDIIQCHFGPNGSFGALLKEIGIKGKLVTMFHGYDVRLGIEKGGGIYHRLFRYGDCLLANSDYSYRHLVMFGADAKKIVSHPVGIDINRFPFRWTNGNKINTNPIKILTVARLVEEKGLEYGVSSIRKLMESNPGLKLEYQIVGGGALEENLRRIAADLGFNGEISFIGPQDQKRVVQMLQQAHIFLLPSIAEALPVVLMEAQAIGIPIVATNVGSVSQVVMEGKSAFLVPERDSDALAERLNYLIQHPEVWPEMGWAGREFVEKNYNITHLNKNLENIYDRLLNGKEKGNHD